MQAENSLTELVLVAVFGGAAGAVLAAIRHTRHDRRERMRDRMLAAADDFLAAVLQVLIELGAVTPQGVSGARLSELSLRIEEMIVRQARVRLLFGYDTPAGAASDDIFGHLVTAHTSLRKQPPDYGAAENERTQAVWSTNNFMVAANEALVHTWFDRFVRRRAFWWVRMRVSRRSSKSGDGGPSASASKSDATG